jgi:hypothetical protein
VAPRQRHERHLPLLIPRTRPCSGEFASCPSSSPCWPSAPRRSRRHSPPAPAFREPAPRPTSRRSSTRRTPATM